MHYEELFVMLMMRFLVLLLFTADLATNTIKLNVLFISFLRRIAKTVCAIIFPNLIPFDSNNNETF